MSNSKTPPFIHRDAMGPKGFKKCQTCQQNTMSNSKTPPFKRYDAMGPEGFKKCQTCQQKKPCKCSQFKKNKSKGKKSKRKQRKVRSAKKL